MIKMPINQIIDKIQKSTNLSVEDINKKIDEKMQALAGYISKEGAAHIVANQLGIKLFEQVSGKLQIKNVLAGMRNVETIGKVQRVFNITEFDTGDHKGKVGSFIIADESGSIRVTAWHNMTDHLKNMKEGDIIKIKSAYARENNNKIEVHLNDNSSVIVNPEGETIGEVKTFTSHKKKIIDLKQGDENVELLGTIVQVYDPRFYEICPECSKRAKPSEGKCICPVHGEVQPKYGYLVNIHLDDGSETIRVTCFRNQALKLLNLDEQKMLIYKDDPNTFIEEKNKLLGTIVKFIGRVKKNDMFDRLEFNTSMVFIDVNVDNEIKALDKEIEQLQK